MKYIKYLAIAMILIAVVATVIHSRRDAIARGLANKALQQYGVTTESLSIERLGTNRVLLSRIFLSRDDGTRYEINDLNFPVSFPSERYEQISIGRLVVTPVKSTPAGTSVLAEMFDLLLSLPALVPNAEVIVHEAVMSGLPRIREIAWRTEGDNQTLALAVESAALSASLSRAGETAGSATLDVSFAGEAAFAQQLMIERSERGYTIAGPVTIELAPWLPILRTAGLVSPATSSIDGRLAGEIDVELPTGVGVPGRIEARLTPAGELRAAFVHAGDDPTTFRAVSGAPFVVRLDVPGFDWTLRHAHSDVVADVGLPVELPLGFDNLECRHGIVCTVETSVAIESFDNKSVVMHDIAFTAPLDIDIDEDGAGVVVAPGATLSIGEASADGLVMGLVTATRFSGASLEVDEAGWSAEADFLDLAIASVHTGEISASLPLMLSAIEVSDSGAGMSMGYAVGPGESTVTFGDFPPIAPGIDGAAEWAGGRLATEFTVTGDRGDELATVTLEYDPDDETGNARITDAGLDMGTKKLSQFWRNWPYALDVVAGRWTAEADLSWRRDGDALLIDGSASHQARGLSGAWDDIAFVNLSTSQVFEIDAGSLLQLSPSDLTVGLLEIGVPIEDIAVQYRIDVATPAVLVDGASASVMGGLVTAAAFDYKPDQERTEVQVSVDSIQLSFISQMIGFEAVSMSGSVSGALPVTLRGETLTVTGGRLESDPPGGTIRYSSGDDDDGETVTSSLGIVLQAMSNFEYESLTSDVDYDENGDLKLKMRLTGTNPEVDPLQPVILNLGLENNIPKMLESLQVTRAVEDVLKRRATRQ